MNGAWIFLLPGFGPAKGAPALRYEVAQSRIPEMKNARRPSGAERPCSRRPTDYNFATYTHFRCVSRTIFREHLASHPTSPPPRGLEPFRRYLRLNPG